MDNRYDCYYGFCEDCCRPCDFDDDYGFDNGFDYDDYVEEVYEAAAATGDIFLIKRKLNLSDEEFEKVLESMCM